MSVKIVIGVCTLNYEKRMIDSLLDLVTQGDFAGWAIPDSCLIPPARNLCIEGAYIHVPDFTHFLFIDDDMTDFTIHHVNKLLDNNVDICSACVTIRKKPYKIVADIIGSPSMQEVYEHIKNQEVKESYYCGMAFTLIKREVLDAMREEIMDKGEPKVIWFNTDRSTREGFEKEVEELIRNRTKNCGFTENDIKDAILLGQYSHHGSPLIGEDIAFCRMARKKGFKVFIDCGVPVGHIGQNVYDLRYALDFGVAEAQKQPLKLVGVDDD